LLVFLCIVPISVQGTCSCSQDSPYSQTCSGDSQSFLGDTELFVGDWQTCDNTKFLSNFNIASYNVDQVIYVTQFGAFQVQGDMIIPSGNNLSVIVSSNPSGTNATLEIFGNLVVDGLVYVVMDNVVVHGDVIVSSTGQLSIESNNTHIYGNVSTQSNISFVCLLLNSTVNIGGSFIAQNGAQNITFVGCAVSVGNGNSSQGINAPGTNITIGAITITTIKASISAKSVILRMDPIDQGQSKFNTYHVIQTTSPINFPVIYEQGWVCGNYTVNAIISTTSGVSVTLSGNPLTIQQDEYCCFEGNPPVCIPYSCNGWICDRVGFIVGWVIGAIIGGAVMIVSCSLFICDFMAVVSQK